MVTFAQLTLNGVLLGGMYALMAIGIALVFGVMRVLNLAHGDFIMIGSYVTYFLFTLKGIHPLLAMPVAAVIGGLLGALVQRYLIARLPQNDAHKLETTSLLLTFGISFVIMNAVDQIAGADRIGLSVLGGSVGLLGLTFPKARLISFAVAAALTGVLFAFLKASFAGKAIRAATQQRDGAQLCGIHVPRLQVFVFGLGSALAAAAGALYVLLYSVDAQAGGTLVLRAISVTILGGLGSFQGAFLGALLLGVAEVLVGFYVNASVAEAMAYLLLIMVLLLRPQGLMGGKRA